MTDLLKALKKCHHEYAIASEEACNALPDSLLKCETFVGPDEAFTRHEYPVCKTPSCREPYR